MTTRYFDPRLQKKQFLDGEYETGPGYNSSQTELVDPAGTDTLTYRTEQTHVPPAGQSYEDPYSDMYELPEGKTYINPSLAPKSGLKDPNAPIPPDIEPVDWKMGNTLNSERNQRSIVRQYVAQKYAKAADPEGVNNAKNYAHKMNTIGNVGHALDRMFTAHSVAHKGPGPDAGFWSGLKQQGQQAVQSAENDRRAKIEEYLTQKKLGSEGVHELGQMRELDRKAAMDNPRSEISQQYQTLFAKQYPEYRDQIMNMPARDLIDYMRAVEEQRKSAEDRTYRDESNQIKRDEIQFQRDKLDEEMQYKNDALKARTKDGGTIERTENPDGSITERVVPKNKAVDSLDRDYVKEYNDWSSNDRAEYLKNRKILEQAISRLKKAKEEGRSDDISGRGVYFKGKIGEGALRSEDSLRIEQDVHQAALGGLKATFGGNPTEGERKAILDKAYDSKLNVDSNIEKILRTIDDMDAKAAAKDEKSKYFEQSQTLGGFKSSGQKPMRVIEPEGYKVPETPMVMRGAANKRETKMINGVEYEKVQGGWRKVKK